MATPGARQRPAEGVGGTRGESGSGEHTDWTDLPSEATLHSERSQDRSRQKWPKSDLRGKWEDLKGEDETGLTLSSVVATSYMWLFTFK